MSGSPSSRAFPRVELDFSKFSDARNFFGQMQFLMPPMTYGCRSDSNPHSLGETVLPLPQSHRVLLVCTLRYRIIHEDDIHSSKTANIILPGLMTEYR